MAKVNSETKALVTVFEDLESAEAVIQVLRDSEIPLKKIEIVTHEIDDEAPEVKTPKVHETTSSSLLDSSFDWGTVGAGLGAIAALVTPFPGLGLGLIFMGGVTGAIMGGIAGIEHAVEDDSVNLPTIKEYKALVNDGHKLVVLIGSHDEVMRAEAIVNELPYMHSHIHPVHGHEFHEHPVD